MKLILVRHGETVDNQNNICQGQTQGKLNENGIHQAQLVSQVLANQQIETCFTSDLLRAVDTCKVIVSRHNQLVAHNDIRLRERYLASQQGKTFAKDWDSLAHYKDAEPVEDMYKRIGLFVLDLQTNYADKTVLIVSHGITLRVLIALCLGFNVKEVNTLNTLDNCSISILEKADSLSFNLIDYNNVSHLKKANMT